MKTQTNPSSKHKQPRHERMHSTDTFSKPIVGNHSPSHIMRLQRTIGNRAVEQHLKSQVNSPSIPDITQQPTAPSQGPYIQRHIDSEVITQNATVYDGMEDMTAVIGSSLHWTRGTNPQPGVPTRIQKVGPIKGRYVGGHMMNQEWGGQGDYNNMIILSSSANGSHRRVDGIIRKLGIIAARLENYKQKDKDGDGTKYEYGVVEQIVVDDPAPDGSENYTGEASIPKGFEVTLRPVQREIGSNDPFTDWTEQAADKDTHYIDNVPPYPAPALANGSKKIKKAVVVSTKSMKPASMTVPDFMHIKGIGKKKAGSLMNAFQKNPSLGAYAMIQEINNGTNLGQSILNLGVTKADLSRVHFRK